MAINVKTVETKNLIANREGYDAVIKKLKEHLSPCNDVVFAILFGSFAGRRAALSSDMDIAIFFSKNVDFFRANDISEDLAGILKMTVDIVILNNASPVMKMQTLKNGIVIVNKDTDIYNNYFVETIGEYDDLKQTRKEIEESILRGRIYA